jgi:hypothetical protein
VKLTLRRKNTGGFYATSGEVLDARTIVYPSASAVVNHMPPSALTQYVAGVNLVAVGSGVRAKLYRGWKPVPIKKDSVGAIVANAPIEPSQTIAGRIATAVTTGRMLGMAWTAQSGGADTEVYVLLDKCFTG